MTAAEIVDRLADHKTIGKAPRTELEWLAARGSVRHLNIGDVLTPKGRTVEGLFIVLSGRISISVDRGAGLHKIMAALPVKRQTLLFSATIEASIRRLLAVHAR